MKKKYNTFMVTHEHRFGNSVYMVETNKDITGSFGEDTNELDDDTKKVLTACDIHFEPHKREIIEIEMVNPKETVRVEL